jgi:hypothetical protein
MGGAVWDEAGCVVEPAARFRPFKQATFDTCQK